MVDKKDYNVFDEIDSLLSSDQKITKTNLFGDNEEDTKQRTAPVKTKEKTTSYIQRGKSNDIMTFCKFVLEESDGKH